MRFHIYYQSKNGVKDISIAVIFWFVFGTRYSGYTVAVDGQVTIFLLALVNQIHKHKLNFFQKDSSICLYEQGRILKSN